MHILEHPRPSQASPTTSLWENRRPQGQQNYFSSVPPKYILQKEQQKPEVTNEKVVENTNVDEISAEPVVITPPMKKEPVAVDLVAVKKAVDASSSVQEARRIAREAKEQASRASVTAEAIIKETQDIINKDNNTAEDNNNKAENKNDDDNNSDNNNNSSSTMKTTLPVGHTSYSWISKDSDDVPFGHTKFSFSGKLVAAC